MKAIEDIVSERERQKSLTESKLDESNSKNDYIAYVVAYAGRAAEKCSRNERENCNFREMMVKTAALCVAAIEAYDSGKC